MKRIKSWFSFGVLQVLVLAAGCATKQPPAAETPEAPAEHEGEHTMPDGTKMKGHHHGHGTHTMPDGTTMSDEEHDGEGKSAE